MQLFSPRLFSAVSGSALLLQYMHFSVLPINYFGHAMHHTQIGLESLKVFTIGNGGHRSRWLWVHCLALYDISFCACSLLYMMGYVYRENSRIPNYYDWRYPCLVARTHLKSSKKAYPTAYIHPVFGF